MSWTMRPTLSRAQEDCVLLYCYRFLGYKVHGSASFQTLGGQITERGEIFCGSDYAGQMRKNPHDDKWEIQFRTKETVTLYEALGEWNHAQQSPEA